MYWRYFNRHEVKRPENEVRAYLNLLIDPKNKFSEFRKDEVALAIEGLQNYLI